MNNFSFLSQRSCVIISAVLKSLITFYKPLFLADSSEKFFNIICASFKLKNKAQICQSKPKLPSLHVDQLFCVTNNEKYITIAIVGICNFSCNREFS